MISQKRFWEKEHDFRPVDHPIVRFFGSQRVGYFRKFIDEKKIGSILDVGAGEVFSSLYLKGICPDVTAVDFSEKMLGKNAVKKKAVADAGQLPFADNSFDMVCAWELFHHLDEPKPAADELIRVARKYICVFEVNRNNPVQLAHALTHSEHRGVVKFSKKYLLRLFADKVKVVKHASVGSIFPNKTPVFIFPVLRHVPFELPFLGISNFMVCEKSGAV